MEQSGGATQYIDWAMSRSFGVIDGNIPYHVTHPEVSKKTTCDKSSMKWSVDTNIFQGYGTFRAQVGGTNIKISNAGVNVLRVGQLPPIFR
jgi:hypothetical protein